MEEVEVTEEDVEILEKARDIMADHHIYSVHMIWLIERLRASLGSVSE